MVKSVYRSHFEDGNRTEPNRTNPNRTNSILTIPGERWGSYQEGGALPRQTAFQSDFRRPLEDRWHKRKYWVHPLLFMEIRSKRGSELAWIGIFPVDFKTCRTNQKWRIRCILIYSSFQKYLDMLKIIDRIHPILSSTCLPPGRA